MICAACNEKCASISKRHWCESCEAAFKRLFDSMTWKCKRTSGKCGRVYSCTIAESCTHVPPAVHGEP
jgi:hypothetical protein